MFPSDKAYLAVNECADTEKILYRKALRKGGGDSSPGPLSHKPTVLTNKPPKSCVQRKAKKRVVNVTKS